MTSHFRLIGQRPSRPIRRGIQGRLGDLERQAALSFAPRMSNGKTLVENPFEQSILQRILQSRLAGDPYRKIARELDADGIKSKLGRKWHAKVIMEMVKRKPFAK